MKEVNIFEVATRKKMRFPYRGQISVEDLWDLNVSELDKIFKVLNRQEKDTKEESLLEKKTKEDEIIEIKIAIVKHIVYVKQEEIENRKREREQKEKKQRIMEVMKSKQDEALVEKSLEELQKMLDEME